MNLFFVPCFIRNSQLLPAFSSAGGQYSSAVGSCHSFPESVLVLAFSSGRLKCSFHDIKIYLLTAIRFRSLFLLVNFPLREFIFKEECKINHFIFISKY